MRLPRLTVTTHENFLESVAFGESRESVSSDLRDSLNLSRLMVKSEGRNVYLYCPWYC